MNLETICSRPPRAKAAFLFAHGAGAGMRHGFMEALTDKLVAQEVAVLRFQFRYITEGRKRPDRADKVKLDIAEAYQWAKAEVSTVPLFAGGKSMGGRILSLMAAEGALPGLAGLIYVGFPLHAPQRDSQARGVHLPEVATPQLFLQGTRDKLANLELLAPLVAANANAILRVIDGADHGFHVLKRTGRSDENVLDEIAQAISAWIDARTL